MYMQYHFVLKHVISRIYSIAHIPLRDIATANLLVIKRIIHAKTVIRIVNWSIVILHYWTALYNNNDLTTIFGSIMYWYVTPLWTHWYIIKGVLMKCVHWPPVFRLWRTYGTITIILRPWAGIGHFLPKYPAVTPDIDKPISIVGAFNNIILSGVFTCRCKVIKNDIQQAWRN